MTPLCDRADVDAAERDLAARFAEIRRATLGLAAPLSPEDAGAQSMPDASPVKWHLAHTTWFFEVFVLEPLVPGHRPVDPAYRHLFNSYYEAVGDRPPRSERGLFTRPSLDDVHEYRRRVDAAVAGALERRELGDEGRAAVELGLHHEQQHQELILTDVKHLFSRNPLRPAYLCGADGGSTGATAALEWIPFPGGIHRIGHGGSSFHFDNEAPRHRVFLEPFSLASRLVTNGEFLAFVGDGGYERPQLWLAEGWDAVRACAWRAPLYWEARGGGRSQFTLRGMRPLVEAEPVCHVSYYEADALARWAGARLPTEAEWEVAAAGMPVAGSFVGSGALHPRPVSDGGLRQMYGELWQWTSSAYSAYPGYRPPPDALGEYNGKFMVNQLVLRGGSCVSPRSHLRATYRNFFPAAARWQFSGIRLAR